jgi:Na+-transporting NADH:ubiquinone oxidoreductase subunit NqrF
MKTTPTFWIGLLLLCHCFLISCRKETSLTSATIPSTQEQSKEKTVPNDATVYVCHSSGAKKYHLRQTCGGLNRCKQEIVTMTNIEAQKIGLELCGYED